MRFVIMVQYHGGYWKVCASATSFVFAHDMGRVLAEKYGYTNVIALVFYGPHDLTWPDDIEVISSIHGMVD